jgi:hypothetical protein
MNRYTWSGLTVWLLPLLALLMNFYPALAPAVEYGPPLKINVSLAEDYACPQINKDGWVVWSGGDSADREIYLYNGSDPPQNLSNNYGYDIDPQINDNGWVVWAGLYGNEFEIYLYNGSGPPQNLSNNYGWGNDIDPQINNNGWVVWHWEQYHHSIYADIYLYDGSGPPQNLSNNSWGDYKPQINDDGWVVWNTSTEEIYLVKPLVQVTDNAGYYDVAPQVLEDGRLLRQGWDGHDYEIYCQETGQDPTQLTDNDSPDVMPQMNAAGHLVWMNWDGGDWEVCYDFGEGPVPLTDNSGAFDVLPQITAEGLIYWQGWDGSDYELYCYDRDTGATTQLTDNSLPDAAPQVNSSSQLTWMLWDGQDWEVCYDMGSGPVQLTNNTGHDLVPQITPEGQVYWQGWDASGEDYEVCRYTIDTGVTENLTDNTVDDCSPAVSRTNNHLVWSQWDGHDYEIYLYLF